jgi:ankyrin repeat protein
MQRIHRKGLCDVATTLLHTANVHISNLPNVPTHSFRTPLILAAANGYTDSVSLLISQGSNVLAHDLFHRTALHGAVSFNLV